MTSDDVRNLYVLTERAHHQTEPDYFERALQEQDEEKRIVFVYEGDEHPCGYVHYNRFPKYAPFKRFNLPEIQDLFVCPDHRRKGIGAALVARCEDEAIKDGHKEIGIGVGIMAEFGNAQRIYAEHGYIPDGSGVVFEREPVKTGEIRPLDDRLCMMLVKQLS